MRGICGVEGKAGVAADLMVGNIAGRTFSERPSDSSGVQANHTWAIVWGPNHGACG